jgi:simple sugar transport system ATP-binding protein
MSPSVATSKTTVEMIGEWMSGLWPRSAHDEPPHAPGLERLHA